MIESMSARVNISRLYIQYAYKRLYNIRSVKPTWYASIYYAGPTCPMETFVLIVAFSSAISKYLLLLWNTLKRHLDLCWQ